MADLSSCRVCVTGLLLYLMQAVSCTPNVISCRVCVTGLLLYLVQAVSCAPNIIVIVADDLGYNDVSWHNPDMKTPNLEKLARSGIVLEQSYVQPICTPTRSAILSGLYPIHTGRQHSVITNLQPTGLMPNVSILPQYLQDLGYKTHMVGKWHLGFCNEQYLPTRRGFSSFLGFYSGAEDYFTHKRGSGYDFRDGEQVVPKYKEKYSTHVFSERAQQIIRDHRNTSQPFFMYLAFQSVHAPLQVPELYENMYRNIADRNRRIFSGMVSAMDEGIGNITRTLQEEGLFDDTIIVFTTDNGGPVFEGANNFPLRGNKNTLWEGGTRAVSFIRGPGLESRVSEEMIHVTDWVPTLVSAAGGKADESKRLDGVDQWSSLVNQTESPRTEFIYNIDPKKDEGSGEGPVGAIRVGRYKLVKGHPGYPDGWIPAPRHRVPRRLFNSTDRRKTRKPYLFDLDADPYEKSDIARLFPDIVKDLERRLAGYLTTMVPVDDPPTDPAGEPNNFNGAWGPGWC